MTNEALKKKVIEVMQNEHCQDAYERMAEAFFDSTVTDDESYHKIGYNLLKAFLNNDVDGAVSALCGWSFQTLMVKAGLLPDIEGVLGNREDSTETTPFERDCLARNIARDIVQEGTPNTFSGNWMVYFEEIQEKYNVNLTEDKEMLDAIAEELQSSYAEKIAESSITHDGFDITYYLDFCPNAE